MADDIVIDKQLFHERLSNFVTKWKADKRSGDPIFQGAGAIATVVGKASEQGSYVKPAAFQVSFPRCLFYHEVELTAALYSYGCWAMSFPRLSSSSPPTFSRLLPPKRRVCRQAAVSRAAES